MKEAQDNRPQIKILGSPSIICEDEHCERPASFLFRSGASPIAGYCEVHAKQRAGLFRIALPESPMNRIRTRWQELNSPVFGKPELDLEERAQNSISV